MNYVPRSRDRLAANSCLAFVLWLRAFFSGERSIEIKRDSNARAANELRAEKEQAKKKFEINLQRSLLSVVDVVLFDIHPISFSIKNH